MEPGTESQTRHDPTQALRMLHGEGYTKEQIQAELRADPELENLQAADLYTELKRRLPPGPSAKPAASDHISGAIPGALSGPVPVRKVRDYDKTPYDPNKPRRWKPAQGADSGRPLTPWREFKAAGFDPNWLTKPEWYVVCFVWRMMGKWESMELTPGRLAAKGKLRGMSRRTIRRTIERTIRWGLLEAIDTPKGGPREVRLGWVDSDPERQTERLRESLQRLRQDRPFRPTRTSPRKAGARVQTAPFEGVACPTPVRGLAGVCPTPVLPLSYPPRTGNPRNRLESREVADSESRPIRPLLDLGLKTENRKHKPLTRQGVIPPLGRTGPVPNWADYWTQRVTCRLEAEEPKAALMGVAN